jgi:hypothetical protein
MSYKNKKEKNFEEKEEEEEKYIPEIDIEIDDFDQFDEQIFNEINQAREFPDQYVLKLEDILNSIKSKETNYLFLENAAFLYDDLLGSLEDSIKFLKSQKKLPGFKRHWSITDSCERLLYEYVYDQNYKNNNNTFEKRIKEYGQPYGENYEIINYDMFDPEFIVINLILGDGDRNKFERKVIFNPNLQYIGISSGILPPNKVCTIINCCEEFFGINENVPKEIQNKYKSKKNNYNSKTIKSKKSNNYLREVPDFNWKNQKTKKNEVKKYKAVKKVKKDKKKEDFRKYDEIKTNSNILRGKKQNIANNVIIKDQPDSQTINDAFNAFDYDLGNFDEEEFFEKEFDTNYGKYEKEKNSHKKLFKTSATNENGQQTTITTTIVENVDKNGIKRGYYVEKEDNVNVETKNYINKKENERDKNERIEKEKRDMKILKDMERKEKERIEKQKYDKNRIKEIPIKLKGKKEFDENEYFDDEQYDDPNAELPEGAVGMHVKHKTITDSNGEPSISVTKTITYPDGSIQQFVNP